MFTRGITKRLLILKGIVKGLPLNIFREVATNFGTKVFTLITSKTLIDNKHNKLSF